MATSTDEDVSRATTSATRTRRSLLRLASPSRSSASELGHESPAFTLKQYAHVMPGMQAAAAAVVADLVRDQATPDRDAAQQAAAVVGAQASATSAPTRPRRFVRLRRALP